MSGEFKLVDFIRINPDKKLCSLSMKDKVSLIDAVLDMSLKEKRGLVITYDLSHSGRRINNRIYSVKGQQNGVHTILSPYAKPILQHHESDKDPIGRFVGAEWQDMSSEAMAYFTDISSFIELQDAFTSDDPKSIFTKMKKFGLLTNKEWPGMGRLRVQARITDQKAIEKFLDGRYITFSAGSTTDRHVCSICYSDWADGDLCEHRHGRIYDGDPCVFVTGTFKVLEGSVVNMPADDLSQVLAMEIHDSKELSKDCQDSCRVDMETVYFTDSTYTMEHQMTEQTTEVTEDTVAEEASAAESVEEVVADDISYSEVAQAAPSDTDVEEDAEASEATDSAEPTVEEPEGTSDPNLQSIIQDLSAKIDILVNLTEQTLSTEPQVSEADTSEETEKEISFDAKLTSEQRNKLKESIFCGPDRSYPVPDKAHAVNALTRAKQHASSELYNKIKACVCRKANENSWSLPTCDGDDANPIEAEIEWTDELRQEALEKESLIMGWEATEEISDNVDYDYDALKEDHARVLKRVETLEKQLDNVLTSLATSNKKDFSEVKDTDKLEVMYDWFDKITLTSEESTTNVIIQVENPSVASSSNGDNLSKMAKKELGDFEKSIVDRFQQILETDGEGAAERYVATKQRYLPRGFHPTNYN